jgi:hypothetical protein
MIRRWDFLLVRSILLSLLSLSRYANLYHPRLLATPSTFSYTLDSQSTTEFQDARIPTLSLRNEDYHPPPCCGRDGLRYA